MNYLNAVQNVLNYIENHISQNLSVAQLAKIALCSEYYFHRIFRASVGMPVIDYLRKRRLTLAAECLLYTDSKITDIATECGFGSQVSFTRSFKKMHGIPPGRYRERKQSDMLYKKVSLKGRKFVDEYMGITFGPMMTRLNDIRMVGLEISGTYRDFEDYNLTQKVWNRLLPMIPRIKNNGVKFLYGVLYCEKEPGIFTYHAGYEQESFSGLPPGMAARTVPASEYALFKHHSLRSRFIDVNSIPDTHGYMYDTWLPNSGYV